MAKKIKPIGVSIDKLTLLSDIKIHHDDFCERISKMGFELQTYKSKQFGYDTVYVHSGDLGYITFAQSKFDFEIADLERRVTHLWRVIQDIRAGGTNPTGESLAELTKRFNGYQATLSEIDERGIKHRLKDIRYELNPKYFDYIDGAEEIFVELLLMLEVEKSISNIHVALDYPVDINTLDILDTKVRKENSFKGVKKNIETIYYGSRASRCHLCIYDKKMENQDNNSIDQYPKEKYVTRFEARLKNNYAKNFLEDEFNPFFGLVVSDDFEEAVAADMELTDSDAGKMLLYFKNPKRLLDSKDTTRKKYQKMIRDYDKLSVVDVVKDYQKEKSSLVRQLENWFNVIKNVKEIIPKEQEE